MYGCYYPTYDNGFGGGGASWLWIIIIVFILFFLFCGTGFNNREHCNNCR